MKLEYAVNISTAKILRKYGLGEDKAAQRFLAEDVERKCQPYVPMSAGSAAPHGKRRKSDGGQHYLSRTVCALSVCRRRRWQGAAPKHYTGQPLTYHGGALRGKQWDKRMMADHGNEVEKDLEGYLKGRGK